MQVGTLQKGQRLPLRHRILSRNPVGNTKLFLASSSPRSCSFPFFSGPHSSKMTFSANASNSDGIDTSIFGSSQVVTGSAGSTKNMPGSPSADAGAVAHPVSAAASAPPTAVYSNPAKSQAKQQTAPKATKTIYLIRHGEGWHNIGYENNLDAHLTPRGWSQTAALQQHLAALQPQLGIELVVVSPLRRTLETAAGVFGAANPPPMQAAAAAASSTAGAAAVSHDVKSAVAEVAGAPDSGWVLMKPQPDRPYEITRRAMIYLPPITAAAAAAAAAAENASGSESSAGDLDSIQPGSNSSNGVHRPLPLLAHEGCRERIGPNVCDKFRDIPLQAADFPGVDFSLIKHQRDVDWERLHAAICQDGGCYLTGEEEAATEHRALRFYRWLMSRPEQRIAVVSHCGFLSHGMRALGKTMLQSWNEAMLQQCHLQQMAAKAAAAGGGKPSDSSTGFGVLDAVTAEAVRVSAGDVAGRMSADWMNCEMRSIQLCWGPELFRSSSTNSSGGSISDDAGNGAGVGLAHAGGLIDSRGWLWATAGDGAVWFPGGFYGL